MKRKIKLSHSYVIIKLLFSYDGIIHTFYFIIQLTDFHLSFCKTHTLFVFYRLQVMGALGILFWDNAFITIFTRKLKHWRTVFGTDVYRFWSALVRYSHTLSSSQRFFFFSSWIANQLWRTWAWSTGSCTDWTHVIPNPWWTRWTRILWVKILKYHNVFTTRISSAVNLLCKKD